jgi:uncharacterized Zn finger protein (UPF0148 family)
VTRCEACSSTLVWQHGKCPPCRHKHVLSQQRARYHARKARQAASGAILRRYQPRDEDLSDRQIEARMAAAYAAIQAKRRAA